MEKPKGRGSGAGWSPFAAAKASDVPWPRFKRAMDTGDVEVIEFGGQKRISDAEVERIRALYDGKLRTVDTPFGRSNHRDEIRRQSGEEQT